jgi:hypothetical protein
MRKLSVAVVLLAGIAPLSLACKGREEAPPAPQAPAPPAVVAATEIPVEVVERPAVEPTAVPVTPMPRATNALRPAIPEPAPTRLPKAVAVPSPSSVAASPTAPPAPTAAPAVPKPAATGVVDPGGDVAVPPTKTGLTRVGAEKCKLCHKVQHASWVASAHAKRTPPLDCESCHGAGSEYKSLAVMKDPAKAKAAGLVDPDAAFCARCHKEKVDPSLLRKVHAHKTAT